MLFGTNAGKTGLTSSKSRGFEMASESKGNERIDNFENSSRNEVRNESVKDPNVAVS